MTLPIIFKILAVILGGIAAYFLWTAKNDAAFASVVGGCVCFFLSVRFEVKERNRLRSAEAEDARAEAE